MIFYKQFKAASDVSFQELSHYVLLFLGENVSVTNLDLLAISKELKG